MFHLFRYRKFCITHGCHLFPPERSFLDPAEVWVLIDRIFYLILHPDFWLQLTFKALVYYDTSCFNQSNYLRSKTRIVPYGSLLWQIGLRLDGPKIPTDWMCPLPFWDQVTSVRKGRFPLRLSTLSEHSKFQVSVSKWFSNSGLISRYLMQGRKVWLSG